MASKMEERSMSGHSSRDMSMSNQLSVPFAQTPLLAVSFALFWIILPPAGRKAEVEIVFARIFCLQIAGHLNFFTVYPSPDPCLIRRCSQPADSITRIGGFPKERDHKCLFLFRCNTDQIATLLLTQAGGILPPTAFFENGVGMALECNLRRMSRWFYGNNFA